MYIRILAIDDEPLSNYPPEDLKLRMVLADCCADTEPEVRRHAIEMLWDAQWTPGSISWRVYRDNGIPTNVGENYSDYTCLRCDKVFTDPVVNGLCSLCDKEVKEGNVR